MDAIDILKLEQRINVKNEFGKILDLVEGDYLYTALEDRTNLMDVINFSFEDFHFVGTSRNFKEYLSDREIFKNGDQFNKYVLFYINAVMNFRHKLETSDFIKLDQYENDYIYFDIPDNSKFFEKLDFHIEFFLERINYKLYYLDLNKELGFKPAIITKRNADVDSVLRLVDPPIALDILAFFDHRIADNLIEKESIIARMYKNVLEKDKKILSAGGSGALYKDTKRIFNFIARHYVDGVEHSVEQRLEYCNMAFTMFLHLIRSAEVYKFQKMVDGMNNEEI